MPRGALIEELARRIAAVRRPHPVRVAIDGVDAAGKTTLADELAAPLEALGREVIRASVDGFHHPAAFRHRRGPDSGEGYYRDAFDRRGLVEALLGPLGPEGTRHYRHAIFDYRNEARVEAPLEEAAPDAILLLDGVFLHRPELRGHWDFSIFVRAGFETTLRRAQQRDVGLFGSRDAVRRRYAERYVPGQRLYLAEVQPERHASVVVGNDDPGRARIVEAD